MPNQELDPFSALLPENADPRLDASLADEDDRAFTFFRDFLFFGGYSEDHDLCCRLTAWFMVLIILAPPVLALLLSK